MISGYERARPEGVEEWMRGQYLDESMLHRPPTLTCAQAGSAQSYRCQEDRCGRLGGLEEWHGVLSVPRRIW